MLSLIRPLPLFVSAAFLVGCGLFEDAQPPLPGVRESVIVAATSLEPDPGAGSTPIRLPPPYVNGSWAQPGGSAAHAMYHLAIADRPAIGWIADVGSGEGEDRALLSQPIVFGNTVFALDGEAEVSAFNLASGRLFWSTDLEDDSEEDAGAFGGGLAFADGKVFVTTGFARVFALDGATGQVVWEAQAPGPLRSAPVVDGGRVFAVTLDNQTIVLNAATGAMIWQHRGVEEQVGLLGTSSPAVAGDVVVVPYSSGELYAMSVDSGRVFWNSSLAAIRRSDPLSDIGQVRGLPVIDRGVVYATSNAGRTVAIDLRRGNRLWERDLGGPLTIWAGGDYLFLITNRSELVALARSDGAVQWVTPLPAYEDPEDRDDAIAWVGPLLASNRLVVAGSHGEAYAISPYTGEFLGTVDLPDGAAVSPIVVQEQLIFLSVDADLVVMR
ncbi:MAG: PQQ-binding-like beta-propeller repeat protein [Pseudomonadota bacterium]